MKMTWIKAYGLFIGLMAILADQASKHWVLEKYGGFLGSGYTEVTPFFNIVLVRNFGISFGLFNDSESSGMWILSAIAIAICLLLGWLMLWRDNRDCAILSYGLIIGGALGNVIDRLIHGAVIDFLDFHVAGYHWPSFNLADSFIFVGVGVLLASNLSTKNS